MTRKEYEEFYSEQSLKSRILQLVEESKGKLLPESKISTIIFYLSSSYNDEGYDIHDSFIIVITDDKKDFQISARSIIPSYRERKDYLELTNYRGDLIDLIPEKLIIHV